MTAAILKTALVITIVVVLGGRLAFALLLRSNSSKPLEEWQ